MFAHGILPDEAPDKEFKAEGDDDDNEDYDDLDFNENWN
jgi:hypothetical protein